jgi:hypothetical protein
MELSASWVVISLRGSAGAESFLLSPFSSNRTIKSIGYERLRVKIIMKGTGKTWSYYCKTKEAEEEHRPCPFVLSSSRDAKPKVGNASHQQSSSTVQPTNLIFFSLFSSKVNSRNALTCIVELLY